MKHPFPPRPLLLALLILVLPSLAQAAALGVYWDANTEPDLDGYLVFWGTAPGLYDSPLAVAAPQTNCRLEGLDPDTVYYVSLKAVDTEGLESPFSAEVSARTNPDPGGGEQPPGGDPGQPPEPPSVQVPSSWLSRYGLDPQDTAGAGDPDRDGYSNLAEFQGDTDPTDCRSVPGEAITRRIEARVRTRQPGCLMRAVDQGADLSWTAQAEEVKRRTRDGATIYVYDVHLDVPCGLRVEIEFQDGQGGLHPLQFLSDPAGTLLTGYIKVTPAAGPIDLGRVRYNRAEASCSLNPLTQVDYDADGVADYLDPDYLGYLQRLP